MKLRSRHETQNSDEASRRQLRLSRSISVGTCAYVAAIAAGSIGDPHSVIQANESPRKIAYSQFLVDLSRQTEPLATATNVLANGTVEIFRYSPNQVRVIEVRAAKLTPTQSQSFWTQLRSLDQASVFKREYGGTGLTGGDQFRVVLHSDSVASTHGFVENAPQPLQRLVQDTARLEQGAKPATLAMAYLRSEPISAQREQLLRQRPINRFRAMDTVPNAARAVLALSIARPFAFVPVDNASMSPLKGLLAEAPLLLIRDHKGGHQLTLWTGRSEPSPRKE